MSDKALLYRWTGSWRECEISRPFWDLQDLDELPNSCRRILWRTKERVLSRFQDCDKRCQWPGDIFRSRGSDYHLNGTVPQAARLHAWFLQLWESNSFFPWTHPIPQILFCSHELESELAGTRGNPHIERHTGFAAASKSPVPFRPRFEDVAMASKSPLSGRGDPGSWSSWHK